LTRETKEGIQSIVDFDIITRGRKRHAVRHLSIAAIAGGAGALCRFPDLRVVKETPSGSGKIAEIAEQIHLGAMVFIRREYQILAIFVAVLYVLLLKFLGWHTALCFLVGAMTSATAGYIGMNTATRANVRTTVAAGDGNAAKALEVAFFGGSIMGLAVASLGLLGLGIMYLVFGDDPETAHALHGFGMGASVVALFSRVGGGIYTKSADVGADLVGKVEAGIPEDDPRNPGVIADNVGDNVGDVAGMGSDIFESYCGAMIATIAMASTMAAETIAPLGSRGALMFLPLALASVGLLSSIVGIYLVKLASDKPADEALRLGTMWAAAIFIVLAFFVILISGVSLKALLAISAGTMGGLVIGLVTEYYTGGKPVEKIAQSGETGPATVMISGLATGMQSVVVPILTISGIIFLADRLVGLYGVGIAAVGMLATVGITMAIDAYGPVADNAGGIAEMGGLGEEARRITDSLDELGNTTAAIGKGFAIGAAALAALAIITAYGETVASQIPDFALHLGDADVLAGLLLVEPSPC